MSRHYFFLASCFFLGALNMFQVNRFLQDDPGMRKEPSGNPIAVCFRSSTGRSSGNSRT